MVQGPWSADTRSQPRVPGCWCENQACSWAERPTVNGLRPPQAQGQHQAQAQAQQRHQEAWHTCHEGQANMGLRQQRVREERRASRASLASLCAPALKTGPTGLSSQATWAPAQSAGRAGRRPGVGGRAWSDGLLQPGVGAWCSYPSPGPPGKAAADLGKGGTQ